MESKFEGKFAEAREGGSDALERKLGEEDDGLVGVNGKVEGEDGWVLPGTGEDHSVLARAAQWFGREKKKGKLKLLDEFARDNCSLFEQEVGKMKKKNQAADDGTGFCLEYDDCHKRYLALFEEQLECFIEEEGFTMEQFHKDCDDVRQGKSVTLFDSEDHSWFLDALLSSLDYQHFHKAMVSAAAKQHYAGLERSRLWPPSGSQRMGDVDYYELLSVERSANDSEIKKAYRKAALRFHPDKNRDSPEEAEHMFKLVAEAYEVLSDPQKRQVYDRYGKRGLEGGLGGSEGFGGATTHVNMDHARELFAQFFGSDFGAFSDPFFGFDDNDAFGRSSLFGDSRPSQPQRRASGRRGSFRGGDLFGDNFRGGGGGGSGGGFGFGGGFGGSGFGGSGFGGFSSMFDDLDELSGPGFGAGGSQSFSSMYTSSVGGGVMHQVKTTTRIENGERVTVTETTVHHPDGQVERRVETLSSGQRLTDEQ
ncbi:DnaJ homolog subfamily B member 3 [Durusdinium trenchii]|uniref:DnaJ homolog subfamily B member 3 n=1 Tax=Durusdinium trenchii TaxID=1381693 RepID=A0ABP0IIY7_9DINO